ncbi:MAG: hypothetical protein D6753_00840 [Planctomycetota bacterium]|nr:MAG: hypothetical protein D6753_00840 [Planctomycetota bacterium]
MELPLPRKTTWEVLQRSRNAAAVRTLVHGLDSKNPDLRRRVLRTLMDREEPAARQAIIERWGRFDSTDRSVVEPEAWRFTATVREMMESGGYTEKKKAIQAVCDLDIVDALDLVIGVAVRHHHALQPAACQCVLEVCRKWGARVRSGKDRASVRGKLLHHLKRALDDFSIHQNVALVDAWLVVTHWDDALQRAIMMDPKSPLRRLLLQRLSETTEPLALQLLAGYLLRNAAPTEVVEIACNRPEFALAVELAKLMSGDQVARHMRQLQGIPHLRALDEVEEKLQYVPDELKCSLWRVVASVSTDTFLVLRGARQLMALDTEDGYRAVADMLRYGRATTLDAVVAALQEALTFSDSRRSADLILEVCQWVQATDPVLRNAAQQFFDGFTFENLIDKAKEWPAQLCRAMAILTAHVDGTTKAKLAKELRSVSPQRRMQALQIVQMLDCAEEMAEPLMELLRDGKLEMRVKVIDVLSTIGYSPLQAMIPDLLADTNTDIQDAADRAQRRFKKMMSGSRS